jgi:hypothetical protein
LVGVLKGAAEVGSRGAAHALSVIQQSGFEGGADGGGEVTNIVFKA